MSQFHKAERKKGKLRLAIAGPAGAGKTYSALLIAFGIGGRVAMIDTERGSGELYDHLGLYDACTIDAPFEPRKYVEAILAAEELGYGTIIIDSLSHAWSGQGGLLDTQGRIADKTGNSWSAWRQVTPKHNELVDTMLQSKCHIIATMRSKMEYTQVEENGKKQVKKLGMSPIQRDGMEYEFTVFMDLDHAHMASTTKDRTTLFDGKYFVPGIGTGKLLLGWLEGSGMAPTAEVNAGQGQEKPAEETEQVARPGETTGPPPQPGEAPLAPEKAKSRGKAPVRIDLAKRLYTRLFTFGLPWDTYQLYCHKRYSVNSLAELTEEQFKEQTKLLDSLKRPERLGAFREVLGNLNGDEQGQAQVAAAAQGVKINGRAGSVLPFFMMASGDMIGDYEVIPFVSPEANKEGMERSGHPKREDGYTMIFNELLEALMCADIPKRARRLIDVQMRFSYGCGPKEFTFLMTKDFSQLASLDWSNARKAISWLLEHDIFEEDADESGRYRLNKFYRLWKVPVPLRDHDSYRETLTKAVRRSVNLTYSSVKTTDAPVETTDTSVKMTDNFFAESPGIGQNDRHSSVKSTDGHRSKQPMTCAE